VEHVRGELEVRFTVTGALLAIPLNMQADSADRPSTGTSMHGWIVAHAHLALLGFSTFMEVAAVYLAADDPEAQALVSHAREHPLLVAADRLLDLLGVLTIAG